MSRLKILISGSHYWLQNNIDQLSYTFGRKITGIHNRTYVTYTPEHVRTSTDNTSSGLAFDLLECLIQRGFAYATGDVRSAYTLVKEALLDPNCCKVVLVVHSQGGIEGGLVMDWLLDEVPQDLLQQLEVYTFGNAANHFNNPRRTCQPEPGSSAPSNTRRPTNRSVGYIEHYANSGDPIAWLGVLRFASIPNRYMGRLFVRPGSGHMLNQHYLDNMFTLGPDRKVLESNHFMDMEVAAKTDLLSERTLDSSDTSDEHREETLLPMPDLKHQIQQEQEQDNTRQTLRVKDFSRLWQYRNGASPERHGSN